MSPELSEPEDPGFLFTEIGVVEDKFSSSTPPLTIGLTADFEPAVFCKKTQKFFKLSWPEIVEMALKGDIHTSGQKDIQDIDSSEVEKTQERTLDTE